MALVSDTHTSIERYVPYQRPAERAALRTAIPRGMKQFTVANAVLALKGSSDTELLSIAMTLPSGFGYVLAEVELNIVVDRAADWNEAAEFLIVSPTAATALVQYRLPMPMTLTGNGGTALDVRTSNIPAGTLSRLPIIPGQVGVFTQIRYANLNTTAQAAGTVSAVVSFWEYDLEQISYFEAHSAGNVLVR